MREKHLLVQLATGDMVAMDAVYHHACLTRLIRKEETAGCDMTEINTTQVIQEHVLDYIKCTLNDKHFAQKALYTNSILQKENT